MLFLYFTDISCPYYCSLILYYSPLLKCNAIKQIRRHIRDIDQILHAQQLNLVIYCNACKEPDLHNAHYANQAALLVNVHSSKFSHSTESEKIYQHLKSQIW